MENKMLTLQQLANITWKSVRTLRRVTKENSEINTDYNNTKLVANLDDVLTHYWMTDQKSYPNSSQPDIHASEPLKSNFRKDSQVVNHQLTKTS